MSKHRNSKPGEGGSTGGGLAKHRKSGNSGKSPKLRLRQQMEAQAFEIKAPPPLPYKNVSDVFKGDQS